MTDFMKMKKIELTALARQAGIKGRSQMTKVQLSAALEELSRAVEPSVARIPGSPVPYHDPGPPPPARPETPELPYSLGERRLCLLPQGPRTAFAYWEVEPGLDAGELVLEVRSLPGGNRVARLTLGKGVGSTYLNLERSGMEIEASLGVEGEHGFRELLRSNLIRLPFDAPSDEMDTLWMTRRKDFEEVFRLSGGTLWPFEGGGGLYGEREPGLPVTSWPTGTGKGSE